MIGFVVGKISATFAAPIFPKYVLLVPEDSIAGMILQQAMGLGVIGFIVGKTVATLWAPYFPKYVLLEPGDALRGFLAVMLICTLASTLAIRAALRVDPATAIGG